MRVSDFSNLLHVFCILNRQLADLFMLLKG